MTVGDVFTSQNGKKISITKEPGNHVAMFCKVTAYDLLLFYCSTLLEIIKSDRIEK